eukprot:jgi/Tetstr1/460029/TSEL_005349.t1
MLQGAVIHYLRDCEESDTLADSEERRRLNEYIKKQREEGFNCLLTYAQMCIMYLPDEMMKPNLHNMWEAAGADDAVVDMFEGTGPGCRGADVEPSTSGDPAIWLECEEAMAKYCQGTGTLEPEPARKEE